MPRSPRTATPGRVPGFLFFAAAPLDKRRQMAYHALDMAPLTRTDKAIVALSALGTAFMGYLTYLHFKPSGSSFCNFGHGFSCDLVNKSVYAEIMGVPISIIGLAYFLGVAFLVIRKPIAESMRVIQLFTAFSIIFSLHLTYIEVFVLGSVCLFCELSKITMLSIMGLASRDMFAAKLPMRYPLIAAATVAGLAFTGVAGYIRGV